MATTTLGRTGEVVSRLGYGSMELRSAPLDATELERLLNSVLDHGINLIDTSPDYGAAEERIGQAIGHRRSEYFLASKCGCPAPGLVTHAPPQQHVFTPDNIRAAVEQSLQRMRTDHLDLVQLHVSLSPSQLAGDDTIAALESLRAEGKVRFLGVSAALPNLPDQIAMGVFDVFQVPYSALDRAHEDLITAAAASGAGTIVRGSVARTVGDPAAMPEQFRAAFDARHRRFAAVDVSDLLEGMPVMELMMRFTLSHPDVHTTLVGTLNTGHVAANAAAASRGPLPPAVYEEMKRRFA